MRQLLQKIRLRERLPVWGLRLLFGLMLLLLSELVMWQNPPTRSILDWLVLVVLYVCLAAIFMDLVVRFQVHGPATLVLASAVIGLVSSGIINHAAFDNLAAGPYGVLVRGLGLETGAALYSLLFFVIVMRGKAAQSLQVFGAMAIGVLWGIWVHWYPIQDRVAWGLVPIETASLYLVVALVITGAMVVFGVPRFRFFTEKTMELKWWEAIVAGFPLFIALLMGMIQEIIPTIPLFILIGVGAFMVWVLNYQRADTTDPSILAEITFPAPNAITYVVLSIAFFVAGILAYDLVNGRDAIAGVAVYWIAFGFGTFGLPVAMLVIFWRVFRAQTAPVQIGLDDLADDDEKDA